MGKKLFFLLYCLDFGPNKMSYTGENVTTQTVPGQLTNAAWVAETVLCSLDCSSGAGRQLGPSSIVIIYRGKSYCVF